MNLRMPDQEPDEIYTKEDLKNVSYWAGTVGFMWGMACMIVLLTLLVIII